MGKERGDFGYVIETPGDFGEPSVSNNGEVGILSRTRREIVLAGAIYYVVNVENGHPRLVPIRQKVEEYLQRMGRVEKNVLGILTLGGIILFPVPGVVPSGALVYIIIRGEIITRLTRILKNKN